jgi:hypothetical protein
MDRHSTRPTDGEIKAPPSPGVHVIGWIGFFCRLPRMPCCRSIRKA